jgi:hypothetical protein
MIDPGIWENDCLAEMDPATVLLFVGCISLADDDGRLKGAPRRLLTRIHEQRQGITEADIEAQLVELEMAGVIHRYDVSGKQYIRLSNWEKHQSIRLNLYKESEFPKCDNDCCTMCDIDRYTDGRTKSHPKRSKEKRRKEKKGSTSLDEYKKTARASDASHR